MSEREKIVEVMAEAVLEWQQFTDHAGIAERTLAALEAAGYAVVEQGKQAPVIINTGIRHEQEPYVAGPTPPEPPSPDRPS